MTVVRMLCLWVLCASPWGSPDRRDAPRILLGKSGWSWSGWECVPHVIRRCVPRVIRGGSLHHEKGFNSFLFRAQNTIFSQKIRTKIYHMPHFSCFYVLKTWCTDDRLIENMCAFSFLLRSATYFEVWLKGPMLSLSTVRFDWFS